MKKRFGNLWTTTISLDEEFGTLKYEVDHLKAIESDNLTAADNGVIQPGKKRKREFEFWLTNVECKKSQYLQIENELREQGPSKHLKSRIEKLIKEVEELLKQGKFPNGVVLDDHANRRLPLVTTSLVGQSCAKNVETILKLLKEDGVFAIGVHGMGGVGKTTIVKEIHNRLLLDSDNAGQVYWVTASQDCSLEKLQNDIGKVIGLGDFSKEYNERKKALLFQRFCELQNSVLIIDDLWDSYVMERIGIPLKSRGCKVVITTRKLEVCRRMPCQHIIKIVPLNKADSWTLFVEKLEELPRGVEQIAREIVEECGGLPLALITMGCCMRGITDVCEWENALSELRKPASRQDDLEVEVFRILKFSFDRLNDDKVQNCFLSCVLFPEDKKIMKIDLVDLWINEGLLGDMENQQDRVNKGHVVLNRLMNACLLESSDVGTWVKMHDLIRDMAIIITKEHPLFIAKAGEQLKQLPEGEKWNKDLVKVSLSRNQIEEIPSGMAPMTPNLTVLMLNGNPLKEIPDSFFVHMKALTHLDLRNTNLERVPKSVSDLENLRGFLLGGCSKLIYVPSVAKLTKLRILDLLYCRELDEAPRGLEILVSLEGLSYIPWDVSDLIGFNEVVQSLTSLRCFRFVIQDPKLSRSEDFALITLCFNQLYEYDKVIWIYGVEYGGDKSSTPILVPATSEYLAIFKSEMKGISCLGDIILSQGEATGLKAIYIDECRGLEHILYSAGTQQGCRSLLCTTAKLEILWLGGLPDLRSIVKIRMPQPFSQLRELFLSGCPKLKVVFPFTDELYLPNLQSINVWSCEELEEIFASNKAIVSSNPTISLPKLEVITLKDLPKIKVLFPFMKELHLPNLEHIYLIACKEVEEIFETNKKATATPSSNSNPTLRLPKLQFLRLEDLPELGSIYRGLLLSCTAVIESNNNCPKLKWWRLPGGGLTSDGSCSINLNEPPACLPHFDELSCPSLMDFSKQTMPLTDNFHSFNQPAYIIPHSQRKSDELSRELPYPFSNPHSILYC